MSGIMTEQASPLAIEPGDVVDPMAQMLEQLTAADPRLRVVAELMRARQVAAAEERTAAAEPDVAQLRARLARAREAYDVLREQYERLAAALGACARCWGEDASCRYCRGIGESGAFVPDPGLFERYVLPAVRRSRTLVASTDDAPRAPHTSNHVEG